MLDVAQISLSEHAKEVLDLWQRNLHGMSLGDPSDKLRLGYLENPAGAGAGLGLRSDEAEGLFGVICLHPRNMYRGELPLRTVNLADFAVEPKYRTLGPALMLMKAAVSLAGERGALMYGLPNRTSAAVCRRAGLNVMPGGKQRYARVLTGEHPRVRAVAPALSAVLRPAISLALRAAEVWRAIALTPRLRCAPTTFEDPMIDALWARRPGHLLLGERSAAMLRWRYGGAGRGDWNICLFRTPSGQVVGMLVWRLKGGMAEVGDFYCVDPERQTASMLNEFCRFARARGAHSISLEFFGAQAVIDQITRAGLRSRQEASIVVTDVAAANTPELADAERWYLTEFDNDAD